MIQGSHWWQHCHVSAFELTGDLKTITSLDCPYTSRLLCVTSCKMCKAHYITCVTAFTCMVPSEFCKASANSATCRHLGCMGSAMLFDAVSGSYAGCLTIH